MNTLFKRKRLSKPVINMLGAETLWGWMTALFFEYLVPTSLNFCFFARKSSQNNKQKNKNKGLKLHSKSLLCEGGIPQSSGSLCSCRLPSYTFSSFLSRESLQLCRDLYKVCVCVYTYIQGCMVLCGSYKGCIIGRFHRHVWLCVVCVREAAAHIVRASHWAVWALTLSLV